jgi:hypothetical protein
MCFSSMVSWMNLIVFLKQGLSCYSLSLLLVWPVFANSHVTLFEQDGFLLVKDKQNKTIQRVSLDRAVDLDLSAYTATLENNLILKSSGFSLKADTININASINSQASIQLFANNTLNVNASLSSPSQLLHGGRVTRIMSHLYASGTRGGTIQILGNSVYLLGNTTLNASGQQGGGLVRIGGDYQGRGNIPTADTPFIAPKVKIIADALQQGRAGQVFIWSNQKTEFRGTISAQSPNRQAEKGVIDVGGKQQVINTGRIN